MSWLRIGSLFSPRGTLANRTLPPHGKEFKKFFEKPGNRSFEDKVVFAIWLRELLQSGKDVWEELREAGFSKEIRHEFLSARLTPAQMITMTEVILFPDQEERNQIRIQVQDCLTARNKRRLDVYSHYQYWHPEQYNLETLEKKTQSMGANPRLPKKQ